MFKLYSIALFLCVFFFYGCSISQEKTEIVVQLSEVDFVYSLCMSPNDSAFLSAFNASTLNYDPEKGNFVDILTDKILQNDSNCNIASYFASFELKDRINFNTSNQEVAKVLKDEVNKAKEATMQVLKKRIESSYTGTSFLSKLTDNTIVEIKGIPNKNNYSITINQKVNKDHIQSIIQRRADLGFWETYEFSEIWENLKSANDTLKEMINTDKPITARHFGNKSDSIDKQQPLFKILNPSVSADGKTILGSEVGKCKIADTVLVNKMLSLPSIKLIFPRDLILFWEQKSNIGENDYLGLYAIKISSRDGKPALEGNCIIEASAEKSDYAQVVRIKMNDEGAKIFARMTRYNINRQIAIVINKKVFSCPRVMTEINGGNCDISGNFTAEEVTDLANLLNAGVMPKIMVKVVWPKN